MHTIIVECLGFNLGNHLVNKLRHAQDRVLHIVCKYKKFHAFPKLCKKYLDEMLVLLYPNESERACRDFRAKFPDDIIHDSLPGQLWFGAECLAAGSNIVDHEVERSINKL